MADKIVSWGGFDSKGTSGMGVTGSFSVSGSMTTNADIFLYSTSSRVSNVRFFGEYGANGQSSYHNLAVDSNNDFVWTSFRGGNYSTTPLTLSGGSSWLIPGGMKIGSITAASISSNGSYTGQYATLTLTGGGYNDATNPSINFITWDAGNQASRFQIHSRTNGGGNGKIVAVPDNGNFIIGSSTDLSAKLAVKGSGTTSSTTSFLVQNANASSSLQVKDDLTSTFGGSMTVISNDYAGIDLRRTVPNSQSWLQLYATGDFNPVLFKTQGVDWLGYVRSTSNIFLNRGNQVALNDNSGVSPTGSIISSDIHIYNATNSPKLVFWSPFSVQTPRGQISTSDGTSRGGNLIFSVNNNNLGLSALTEYMRITQVGNVGIGTSTPTASLHISGSSGSALLEIDSPAVNNILFVAGSGNVGIGTGTPGSRLLVVGGTGFKTSPIVGIDVTQTNSIIGPTDKPPIGLSLFGTYTDTNTANNTIYQPFLDVTSTIAGDVALNGGTRNLINLSPSIALVSANNRDINSSTRIINIASSFTARIANNITGIYYNPTFTLTASNVNHRAIETVTGNVLFNTTSGNTLIGTSTDVGFKLDVNGTGRFSGNLTVSGSATNSLLVRGSGTTSSTTSFLVQNANASSSLAVTDSGSVLIGTTTDNGYRLDMRNGTALIHRGLFGISSTGGQSLRVVACTGGADNVFSVHNEGSSIEYFGITSNTGRVRFDSNWNIGSRLSADTQSLFIQTDQATAAISTLTVRGGNATASNRGGGNLILSSGASAGSGDGINGYISFNTTNTSAATGVTNSTSEVARFSLGKNLLVGTTTDSNFRLDVSGSGRFTNSLTVTGSLTITGSNAAVTMPSRPAFRVTGSGTMTNLTTTQNGDGTLNQNNWAVDYQQGSALTGSTGVFTAPLAGLYQISLVGRNSGYSSGISQLAVVKYSGASSAVQIMVEWASSSTMNHTGGSSITYMNVGDTLKLKVLAGEINFDGNDNWSVAYIG